MALHVGEATWVLVRRRTILTATVLGPVKPSVNLCGDVLEGLGIRSVTKGSRKAVSLLADLVEQAIRPVSGASCKDR